MNCLIDRARDSRYAGATFRKEQRAERSPWSSKDLEAIQKWALAEVCLYQTLMPDRG